MKTSIVMSVCDEPLLKETMENLIANAYGGVEFVLGFDGTVQEVPDVPYIAQVVRTEKQIGRRRMINRLLNLTSGEYIYHVDAHCQLSSGWDVKLQQAAGVDGISQSILINYMHNKATVYKHIKFDRKTLSTKRWPEKEPVSHIEEMRAITGCSFMHHKDIRPVYDESLAGWGSMGKELSLWAWLCGELPTPIRLCSGVICNHKGRRHNGSADRKDWPNDMKTTKKTRVYLANLYLSGKAKDQVRPFTWIQKRVK